MTRRTETRGGTFGRLLGTAVHANGWWFRHAANVDLRGDSRSSHDLSRFTVGKERLDPGRIRTVLPLAFQMADGQGPPIGFIAARVEDASDGGKLDIAYPFLLQECDGRVQLAFGTLDPEPSLQDEIVAAFVERLARALAPT